MNTRLSPTVELVSVPPAVTTATDATFKFTASGASKVECLRDAGSYKTCNSPKIYSGLALGSHIFKARARSKGAPTAYASATWEIVASAPPPPPPPSPRTLSVSVGGTGTGTVTGPGISCPGDCSEPYADGTIVNLAAGPTAGASFASWGGYCSGSGACQVPMSADRSVSASFTASPAPPPPPPPAGPAYYVSPNGSDSNAGTSTSAPWRTLAKVNATSLSPGTSVLFQGAATVVSGGAGDLYPDPGVTYGSYGTGKAVLQQGVYLCGEDSVTVEGLRIDRGPGWGGQGFLASSSCGNGVHGLAIRNSEIVNVSIAINSANTADSNWQIVGNYIQNTGDSALIIKAAYTTISDNTILDAGFNSAITYGKHGVYATGPFMTIQDNTITHFRSNGLSMRYRGSLVERNVISGGPIGIAWFQDDPVGGTAVWRNNTISNYSAAGIYLDKNGGRLPPTQECFQISGNTIESLPRPMDLLGITSCSTVS
ncbi:MAG: right-handed parallel beta-helix repeat-containing protein [Actinomycetota bacterium]